MSSPPAPPSSPRNVPGIVIPLIFLSVLLLAAIVVTGMLGFGVVIPGLNTDDPVPTVGAPGQALQASGFTVEESRTEGTQRVVIAQVSATNVTDDVLERQDMMVQCLDGGNVSGIQNINVIQPDETRTFTLELRGTGDPRCAEPVIEFDDQRDNQSGWRTDAPSAHAQRCYY